LIGQDLDRDVALQLRVSRAIHLSHSAFAKQSGDFVPAKLHTNSDGHRARQIG